MTCRCLDDPYRQPLGIGRVEDSRRAGQLVLPLLEGPATDENAVVVAAKPVLTLGVRRRVNLESLERASSRARKLRRDLFPSLRGGAAVEAQRPAAGRGRRWDPTATLLSHPGSAGRARHEAAVSGMLPAQRCGEPRIGVHKGRIAPLADEFG